MTTPHNTPGSVATDGGEQPEQGWGAPVPVTEKRGAPWSAKKIVISAVVAVAIVAGGTAAVLAATGGNSTSGNTAGAGGPGGFPGGMGGMGGLADALHGEFVTSTGATERLQTGTVTAVSATSITVKSSDGYTQTYTVGSGTRVDQGQDSISNVATGNTVTVVATVSGQAATAATIEDSTVMGTGRVGGGQGGGPGGFGGGGFGGPGQ